MATNNTYLKQEELDYVFCGSLQNLEPSYTALSPLSLPQASFQYPGVSHQEMGVFHVTNDPYQYGDYNNGQQRNQDHGGSIQQLSSPVLDSGVSSGSESLSSSPATSPAAKVKQSSAQDQGGRPEESYIYMISNAILSSPQKQLLLGDIYSYILEHYPYFDGTKAAWKNCVRHNLSVNECFIRVKKGNSGRGYFWCIHDACVESVKQGIYCRRTLNQMVFNYKKSCSTTTPVSSMVSVTSTAVNNQCPVSMNNTQPTESAAYTPHTQPPLSAYTPMTCTVVQPGAFMANTVKGRMTKKQRYLAAHAECVQLLGYTLQQ